LQILPKISRSNEESCWQDKNRLKVILVNIFGGITRCDDVANGLLKAYEGLTC